MAQQNGYIIQSIRFEANKNVIEQCVYWKKTKTFYNIYNLKFNQSNHPFALVEGSGEFEDGGDDE